MTQPVQEPTESRVIGGLSWGERQLRRRPGSPGGVSAIPWVQRIKTTDQSISNGTNDTEILWETGADGSTDPDWNDYFSIVTPTDKTIRVLQQGVYEVTAQLQWASNKIEGSVISLNGSNFTWNKGWWDEQNAGHTIEHNQTFTFRRRMVALTILRLYVVQYAAAPRTIESGWWEVQYVGSYNGSNPTD